MDYSFILVIAIIMLSTKVLGLASEKVNMPQVVGALIAGLLLGPSCFGLIGESDFKDGRDRRYYINVHRRT